MIRQTFFVLFLFYTLLHPTIAMAAPAVFDWGSFNSGGLTTYGVYDIGNAVVLQTGDWAQLIWAGPGGSIDPPMPDGSPGGDDVLLDTNTIQNGLPWPPPAQNRGYIPNKMYVYDTDNPQNGGVVYIRAWNAGSPAAATAYGNSQTAILTHGTVFTALRWHTNIIRSTYTGPSGGNWNTPGNWSYGAIPDSSTYVVLPAGASTVLSVNAASYVLYLEDTSLLDLSTFNLTTEAAVTNRGTISQTLTVDNSCTPGSPCRFMYIQNVAGTQVRYRGVDLATSNNLGAVEVGVRGVDTAGGEYCTSTGAGSPAYAERCYQINPANNDAATVRLWALTSELRGIPQGSLAPYRWGPATGWVKLTAIQTGSDAGAYSYAQGDTTDFSPFLLGDTNEGPTSVTVMNFSATTSTENGLPIVLLVLSVVGVLLLMGVKHKERLAV